MSIILVWGCILLRGQNRGQGYIPMLLLGSAWAGMGLTQNLCLLPVFLNLFVFAMDRWLKRKGLGWRSVIISVPTVSIIVTCSFTFLGMSFTIFEIRQLQKLPARLKRISSDFIVNSLCWYLASDLRNDVVPYEQAGPLMRLDDNVLPESGPHSRNREVGDPWLHQKMEASIA